MTRTKRTIRLAQLCLLLVGLAFLTRPAMASSASACSLCIGYDICASHHEGATGCMVAGGVCDIQGSSCGI